jgi:Ca2+-binding RTX toxin-like protein
VDYDGPSGIEYQGNVSGAPLRNYGEINSLEGYGLDFSEASSLTNTFFINHGTIQGGLGSSRGDNAGDAFINCGLMDGDVDMCDGADTFDNRAGTVDGEVTLGDGNDFYNGRLDAFVSGDILGGAGNDTLHGGHNEDVILGGEDGEDLMLGNDGDDVILGGNDNDRMYGGRGTDQLFGQTGADTFTFLDTTDTGLTGATCDQIYDFD